MYLLQYRVLVDEGVLRRPTGNLAKRVANPIVLQGFPEVTVTPVKILPSAAVFWVTVGVRVASASQRQPSLRKIPCE
jgi:hypothetical protein